MLRIGDFTGRTARARCVTTHLWTARLWLACLFRSSHYARHDSRHHKPHALATPSCVSTPRKPCSGSCSYGAVIVSYVANRSQSCLFSRPLRSRFLCLRPASWPVAFSAMPAASSKLSGCSAAQTACLRCATTMRSQPHMILLLAYLPGWYLREKEII